MAKKTKKEQEKEREVMSFLLDALGSDSKSADEYLRMIKLLNDQLVSVSEAARIRDTTRVSIYELIERGRLHTVSFAGNKYLIRKEVEEFKRGKPGPRPQAGG